MFLPWPTTPACISKLRSRHYSCSLYSNNTRLLSVAKFLSSSQNLYANCSNTLFEPSCTIIALLTPSFIQASVQMLAPQDSLPWQPFWNHPLLYYFLFHCLTEVYFMYHKIHLFQMDNSMIFSNFTQCCNHHHRSVWEHFHPLPQIRSLMPFYVNLHFHPEPKETSNLLSISLLLLDISYE